MQCVILAGGLGTRMKPLTEKIPKSLLEANGKPFIHYQLDYLKRQGVSDVVLCIGHMGELIEAYAEDGRRWDLPLRYVHEGSNLKGTGGALRLAADQGRLQERFLVLYGDSFLPIDFRAVWQSYIQGPFKALMTVLRNEEKWDKSNVHFDGGKVILYDKTRKSTGAEKMAYIDYGLSGLSRSIIEEKIPSGERRDLADLFHELSKRGELGGFEVMQRFFEIGSPAGLADFADYISRESGY